MKLLFSFDELHTLANNIKLMPMSDDGYYYLANKLFENDGWDNMYDISDNEIIVLDNIKYVMLSLESN